MSALQSFTKADVAKHSTENDLWVIYRKEVFAFPSDFVDSHPGGPVLMECAGKDATIMFEDGPHGDNARSILAGFKIGVLVDA